MAPLPSLIVVFALIALLELTDRTNFALIGLASRRRGFATWAGAALGFLVTSAIAVAIGTVLLAVLARDLRYVQLAGGILILAYAAYLATHPEEERGASPRGSAFVTAFLLILLLEMGDSTMILLVLFTGSFGDPVGVFLAGASALLAVAALACTVGAQLGARVEPRRLRWVVVGILLIVGSLTILFALEPHWLPAVLS